MSAQRGKGGKVFVVNIPYITNRLGRWGVFSLRSGEVGAGEAGAVIYMGGGGVGDPGPSWVPV